MERSAKRSKAGLYLLIVKQFGGLAHYYARRYAQKMDQNLMEEDIATDIIYEMMEIYEDYLLKDRPEHELVRLVKVVPIFFWQQYLNREKNKRRTKVDTHTIQIEDKAQFENLYDKYYQKFIDSAPKNEDEKEFLDVLLYQTEKLHEFAKVNHARFSRTMLERFFVKERGWKEDRFNRVWQRVGRLLRLAA